MGKGFDWPIEQMTALYLSGSTCREIAAVLNSKIPAGAAVGRGEAYIVATDKLVQKVLKKTGCQMRPTGAPAHRNGNWNGGRTVDKHGYILVKAPDHPEANHSGYVREHRLVAEKMLGRRLRPGEVVHHINDDPADNRPENLIVFETNGHHLAATLKGKCPKWTPDGLDRIRNGVSKAAARKRDLRDTSAVDDPRSKRKTRRSTTRPGKGRRPPSQTALTTEQRECRNRLDFLYRTYLQYRRPVSIGH
jgi:hypothetical protein